MFAAGSRPYMAPEQFQGLRFCTERSDLYSLGVTLFHALTGKCPFEADTDQGFLEAHRGKSPPPLVEVTPALRESGRLIVALQNIVTKLLAKRPEERYPSAAELERALECAEGGGEITRPRVTSPEAVRIRKAALATALVLFVLFLAALGGFSLRQAGGPAKIARQRILAHEQEASKALAEERLRDRALALRRAAAEAREGGALPPAEAREIEGRAAETEAARAQAFAAAAAEGANALERGELALASGHLDAAVALEVGEDEGRRTTALRREHGQRAKLAAGLVALRSGEVALARGRVAELRGEELSPALAPIVLGLDRLVEIEEAIAAGDPARAERQLQALRGGGPALERILDFGERERAALEHLIRQARASSALAEAERKGDARGARAAVRDFRKLTAPGEAAALAALDRAEARACEAIFAEVCTRAEGLLANPAEAPTVARLAREALHSLPGAEAAAFRELAARFAADRRASGDRTARRLLRERLGQIARPRAARSGPGSCSSEPRRSCTWMAPRSDSSRGSMGSRSAAPTRSATTPSISLRSPRSTSM
jgi:hypothetical protein